MGSQKHAISVIPPLLVTITLGGFTLKKKMYRHITATDASSIAEALQSFLQQKQLDLRKLIGQGYDGAATFAGKISGVHK